MDDFDTSMIVIFIDIAFPSLHINTNETTVLLVVL